MALSGHYATSNIGMLKLVLTNSIGSIGETADGADTTVTAGIEYPIGNTPVQVTFGGSASGTITSGTIIVSDWVNITIPKGALFRVRVWRANSVTMARGNPSTGLSLALLGDVYNTSATTTADLTTSTSIPSDTSGGTGYHPVAILTYTREPSVMLVGDSRMTDGGDVVDAAGSLTYVARALTAAGIGWISCAASGTRITGFTASGHANRITLKDYVTHVVCGYPINDFIASASVATVQSEYQTLWGLFPDKIVHQCTCEPAGTSTSGNWTSDADQTAGSYAVTNVPQLNDWLKSLPSPVKRCFDTAAALSSATDRTKWDSDGTNKKYTGDGIHAGQFGNIKAQAAIDPKAFRR